MRKTLVALCFILAISLVGVSFAQENTTAAEVPSIPSTPSTPSNEPPVETLVNTGKEEQNIQETKPSDNTFSFSDEPMTMDEMKTMCFFDIEKDTAIAFAAQSTNCIIKAVTGTVITVSAHELHINVPQLNNDFCFNCVEPFAQQLGDTVTVYVVIQAQN